jgi:hypothetical protein
MARKFQITDELKRYQGRIPKSHQVQDKTEIKVKFERAVNRAKRIRKKARNR